jgi:glutathione S-transferase
MSLTLYFHPLSSFCHKVLIALYEKQTAFEGKIVDFSDPGDSAKFLHLWPVGKFPVLHDTARERTIPETTIIIEYLDQRFPAAAPLFPLDPVQALDARLWDRLFDLYVSVPVQKIVAGRIRAEGERDPKGVEEARAMLATAYDMLERHLQNRTWAIGDAFTVADCAAAPALFYADTLRPFLETHPALAAYFNRLMDRPSVRRTYAEARPYFHLYPYREAIRARFLNNA